MTRIAAEANVPRKFLELILADLRDAGLLHSHRGKMGGYVLSRPAHLISLGDVIRVIEGPLALVPACAAPPIAPARIAERGRLRDPPRHDARARRDRADPGRHQPGGRDGGASGGGVKQHPATCRSSLKRG
ncbi:Rrf2 family transcriptional regulator [Sphingomonas sp. MMS24-JH45]